jgi:hypothetical protein
MAWFIGIMGVIFISLFCMGIYVEKMNQRRELDLEYDKKITGFFNQIDPYYKFIYNLCGWVLALLVFYYIYLG